MGLAIAGLGWAAKFQAGGIATRARDFVCGLFDVPGAGKVTKASQLERAPGTASGIAKALKACRQLLGIGLV